MSLQKTQKKVLSSCACDLAGREVLIIDAGGPGGAVKGRDWKGLA